jgi:hypothetical protein
MKNILGALLIVLLMDCNDGHKPGDKTTTAKTKVNKGSTADTTETPIIRFSDKQLEEFLDSIGKLPTQPLADKAAFYPDSVFKSPRQLDTLISPTDTKILKRAIHKGVMAVKTARRIFNNNAISYHCNTKSIFLNYRVGLIPVIYYPFNTNKGEYGICIGDPDNCLNAYLYFFKGNRIIAKHDLYQRHSDKLRWFVDGDGESVVYYSKEFDEGSGVWWFNTYFYKYEGNKLLPVLDEINNANLLQPSPWGARELWLESSIQKTNPLTIKMVYHQELPNTTVFDRDTDTTRQNIQIVNDSTIVQYDWNQKTKTFEGQYVRSKITKPQIISYYLVDNEVLFINCYYNKLKAFLSDKKTRDQTLYYLNLVKSHCEKKQRRN